MQCDTWWKTLSVFSSGILLAAQADAGDSKRDQGTSDLGLQWDASMQVDYVLQWNIQFNSWARHTWWTCYGVQGFVKVDDARWKHWSKHDTASIQVDYVLQWNIQFNSWARHTWWTCYGVQSFVKVVTECGTKASSNQEILCGKWIKRMRKRVWRLKIHPTLIHSCHSFGRLCKLVLGQLNNQWVWEVISKTYVRVWPWYQNSSKGFAPRASYAFSCFDIMVKHSRAFFIYNFNIWTTFRQTQENAPSKRAKEW